MMSVLTFGMSMPVSMIVEQVAGLVLRLQRRDAAIDVHTLFRRRDIALRQICRHRQIGGGIAAARFFLAAFLQNRLLQQLQIHIITDGHHVARLLGPQQIARAADFKVAHGDAEP